MGGKRPPRHVREALISGEKQPETEKDRNVIKNYLERTSGQPRPRRSAQQVAHDTQHANKRRLKQAEGIAKRQKPEQPSFPSPSSGMSQDGAATEESPASLADAGLARAASFFAALHMPPSSTTAPSMSLADLFASTQRSPKLDVSDGAHAIVTSDIAQVTATEMPTVQAQVTARQDTGLARAVSVFAAVQARSALVEAATSKESAAASVPPGLDGPKVASTTSGKLGKASPTTRAGPGDNAQKVGGISSSASTGRSPATTFQRSGFNAGCAGIEDLSDDGYFPPLDDDPRQADTNAIGISSDSSSTSSDGDDVNGNNDDEEQDWDDQFLDGKIDDDLEGIDDEGQEQDQIAAQAEALAKAKEQQDRRQEAVQERAKRVAQLDDFLEHTIARFHADGESNIFAKPFLQLIERYQQLFMQRPDHAQLRSDGYTAVNRRMLHNGRDLPTLESALAIEPITKESGKHDNWASDELIAHELVSVKLAGLPPGEHLVTEPALIHWFANKETSDDQAEAHYEQCLSDNRIAIESGSKGNYPAADMPMGCLSLHIVYNPSGGHWVSAQFVVNATRTIGKIILRNSLSTRGHSHKRALCDLPKLAQLISQRPALCWQNVVWGPVNIAPCATQANTDDCGFFACDTTRRVMQGVSLYLPKSRQDQLEHGRSLRWEALRDLLLAVDGDDIGGLPARSATNATSAAAAKASSSTAPAAATEAVHSAGSETLTAASKAHKRYKGAIDPVLLGADATGTTGTDAEPFAGTGLPEEASSDDDDAAGGRDTSTVTGRESSWQDVCKLLTGTRSLILDCLNSYELPVPQSIIEEHVFVNWFCNSQTRAASDAAVDKILTGTEDMFCPEDADDNSTTSDIETAEIAWQPTRSFGRLLTLSNVGALVASRGQQHLVAADDLDKDFVLRVPIVRKSGPGRQNSSFDTCRERAEALMIGHHARFSRVRSLPIEAVDVAQAIQAIGMGDRCWYRHVTEPQSSRRPFLEMGEEDPLFVLLTALNEQADQQGTRMDVLFIASGWDSISTSGWTWTSLATTFPMLECRVTLALATKVEPCPTYGREDAAYGLVWEHFEVDYLAQLFDNASDSDVALHLCKQQSVQNAVGEDLNASLRCVDCVEDGVLAESNDWCWSSDSRDPYAIQSLYLHQRFLVFAILIDQLKLDHSVFWREERLGVILKGNNGLARALTGVKRNLMELPKTQDQACESCGSREGPFTRGIWATVALRCEEPDDRCKSLRSHDKRTQRTESQPPCGFHDKRPQRTKRQPRLTGSQPLIWMCPLCPFIALQDVYLQRHFDRTHKGHSLLSVPSRESALADHEDVVFERPECGFQSRRCTMVQVHMVNVHATQGTIVEARPREDGSCGAEKDVIEAERSASTAKAIPAELKIYECLDCPYLSDKRVVMAHHVKRVHKRSFSIGQHKPRDSTLSNHDDLVWERLECGFQGKQCERVVQHLNKMHGGVGTVSEAQRDDRKYIEHKSTSKCLPSRALED